jgi:heme d1 biosynthesis protein
MFRIRQYMNEIESPTPIGPARKPPGPVVIWNLIRRCNLACKHCYSISADYDFPDELSTDDIYTTMDDLKAFHVPVLILSGGEPLLHPDIFKISRRAKEMGFYVGFSTNGTLIDKDNINNIKEMNYDYVGISIDGIGDTHDHFRHKQGAFDASINAIRLCRDNDIKVGIRFTITQDNAHELPKVLKLLDEEDINKFYLSHLNYSGRGNRNRKDDATHIMTRKALDLVFAKCWEDIQQNKECEYVTGNNDADAVYLLHWVNERFPDKTEHLRQKLTQWGGNSSGVNIANIDNLGDVHPDTFWWHYNLGNVRDRKFSEIWNDCSDPIMAGLKQQPRKIKGRCGECHYFDVCGGNARIRAFQLTGDPWAEDPACYLTDDEIGIQSIESANSANQHEAALS